LQFTRKADFRRLPENSNIFTDIVFTVLFVLYFIKVKKTTVYTHANGGKQI